jgi:hypothetical protein
VAVDVDVVFGVVVMVVVPAGATGACALLQRP